MFASLQTISFAILLQDVDTVSETARAPVRQPHYTLSSMATDRDVGFATTGLRVPGSTRLEEKRGAVSRKSTMSDLDSAATPEIVPYHSAFSLARPS